MPSGNKPNWIQMPSSNQGQYYPTAYAGAMSDEEQAKYANEKKESSNLLGDMMSYATMLRQADEEKQREAHQKFLEMKDSHRIKMEELQMKTSMMKDAIAMRKESEAIEGDHAFTTIAHDLASIDHNNADASNQMQKVMQSPFYAKALSSPYGSQLGGIIKDTEKRISDMRAGITATAEKLGIENFDPAQAPRNKDGTYDWHTYTTSFLPKYSEQYWASKPSDDEIIKQAQTQAMAYNTKVPYKLRNGFQGMADPVVIAKMQEEKPDPKKIEQHVRETGSKANYKMGGADYEMTLADLDLASAQSKGKPNGSSEATTAAEGQQLAAEGQQPTATNQSKTPQVTYSQDNPLAVEALKVPNPDAKKESARKIYLTLTGQDPEEEKKAMSEFEKNHELISDPSKLRAMYSNDNIEGGSVTGYDAAGAAKEWERLKQRQASLTKAYGFTVGKDGKASKDYDQMDQTMRDITANGYKPNSKGVPNEQQTKEIFKRANGDPVVADELARLLGFNVDSEQ